MALVAHSSGTSRIDSTAALQTALTDFEKALTKDQRQTFFNHVQHAQQAKSDPYAVMLFVAELDAANHGTLTTSVAPRLLTFLDATQQFTRIVDTFVSSNPALAALLWGSVKLAILAATNVAQYFDNVTAMIMKIGKICPVYGEFASLYIDSIPLQSALSEYYALVVRFSSKIIEVMQRNHVTQLISSIFNPFNAEFGPLKDRLDDAANMVELRITLAAQQAAQRSSELALQEATKNKEHRGLFRKFHSDFKTEQGERRLRKRLQETVQLKASIRDQISVLDHLKPWKQIQRRRHKNTAEWFADEEAFRNWRVDNSSSTLWCFGKMGVGKSVLVSNIVAFFFRNPEPGRIISYHFCRAEYEASTSARNILGTISRQLLDRYIEEAEHDDLRELQRKCRDLDAAEFTHLLLSCLKAEQKYFIIIDGLDECPQSEVDLLAATLNQLCDQHSHKFSLLLCGRPELEHTSLKLLNIRYRVSVSSAATRADVASYVEDTLIRCLKEQRIQPRNHEVMLSVADLLDEEYSDMFLFVHLFIEELCILACETDVLAALENPPRNIGDFIARKLGRVRAQTGFDVSVKILEYSGVTKRPLDIDEAGELLSLSLTQRTLDRASIPCNMHQIVASCQGLLYIDEEDETIHYVHRTVRQCLFSRIRESSAEFAHSEIDLQLGRLCLTYLNFNDFNRQLIRRQADHSTTIAPLEIGLMSTRNSAHIISKAAQALLRSRKELRRLNPQEMRKKTEEILGTQLSAQLKAARRLEFCLLEYVQNFWIHHLTRLSPDEDPKMWHIFSTFVERNDDFIFRPWRKEGKPYEYDDHPTTWALEHHHAALLLSRLMSSDSSIRIDQIDRALECAVTCGYKHLIVCMLQSPLPSARILQNGLILAVRNGDLEFVEFLLQMDDRAVCYGALREAAITGHADIMGRLLVRSAGADLDCPNQLGGTALAAAAARGHIDVLEQLLIAGADDKEGALRAAAESGHLVVVKRLLAAGAYVDTSYKNTETALTAAASNGHLNVTRYLLTAGATVLGCYSLSGRTALQAAAQGGHLDVIEQLLAVGAYANDINTRTESRRTALQIAAEGGRSDIVRQLLAAGADDEATEEDIREYHATGLQAAVAAGHLSIVEQLLAANAGGNLNAYHGHEALRKAAEKGYADIVQRLLMANAKDFGSDFSAREAAFKGNHMKIVKLLDRASKPDFNSDSYSQKLSKSAGNSFIEKLRSVPPALER